MSTPTTTWAKIPHSLGAEAAEVTAMLHQTMEPLTAPLIRISPPGDLSSEGTAVSKPTNTFTLDWTALPVVPTTTIFQLGPQIMRNGAFSQILGKNSQQPFVLLMDPIVGYITRTIAPASAWALVAPGTFNIFYNMSMSFSGVAAAGFTGVDTVAEPNSTINLPITTMTFASGPWRPYGDYTVAGNVDGRRVFWADGSDSLNAAGVTVAFGQSWGFTFKINNLGAAPIAINTWNIQLNLHTSENDRIQVNNWLGAAVPAFGSVTVNCDSLNYSGYFSIDLSFNDALLQTPIQLSQLQLKMNTVYAYSHVVYTSQQDKALMIDNLRVNGSSMLLSNTTTDISKGGTVYAVQSPGERPWNTWLTSEAVIAGANTQSRTVQPWNKGLYCYVKPQGAQPLRLETAYPKTYSNDTVLPAFPNFRPFADRGYVVALISPPVQLTTTPQYPTAQVTATFCRAIEFSTTDQFFNVKTSEVASSYFNSYADLIRTAPQFFENPIHLATIGRLLTGAVQKVIEWAPRVANAVLGTGRVAQAVKNELPTEPMRNQQRAQQQPRPRADTRARPQPRPRHVRISRKPGRKASNSSNNRRPSTPRKGGLAMHLDSKKR